MTVAELETMVKERLCMVMVTMEGPISYAELMCTVAAARVLQERGRELLAECRPDWKQNIDEAVEELAGIMREILRQMEEREGEEPEEEENT